MGKPEPGFHENLVLSAERARGARPEGKQSSEHRVGDPAQAFQAISVFMLYPAPARLRHLPPFDGD